MEIVKKHHILLPLGWGLRFCWNEIVLHNLNTYYCRTLFLTEKFRRSDGLFSYIYILGFTRYIRGFRLFTIYDLAKGGV